MLPTMTSFSRYLAGQHVQVWTELRGVGTDVREDDQLLAEAEAVARETMSRVKRNLERLREGLPDLGYRFTDPAATLVGPPDSALDDVARVEAVIGPLPLAVRTFWEVVGSVDFSGAHPQWPHRLLDPLMVDFDADYILDTFHDKVDQGAHRPGQAFAIDFSPDDLHKAEISGGPPYAIEAPNLAVDGIVLWEIHQTTFVNYLRTVIQHAGLGGLSLTKRHGHDPLPVPGDVQELVSQLEPF